SATIYYRGSIFIWIFSNLLYLVVIASVWLSSDAGDLIAGYTKKGLISYYLIGFLLHWIVNWLPFYSTADEIKSGEIVASTLTKPFSYYWRKFAEEAGWHTFTVFLGLALTIILAFGLKEFIVFEFHWNQLILFALATIFAIFCIFGFSLCLGLLAFWFTEVWTVDTIFWAGRNFLGGWYLPVSFFPGVLQTIIRILPFRYIFSFPLELFFGKLSPAEIISGFAICLFWILFFAWLYKIMWEKGRKSYTAFGQ
ncbi:MAG: ABC-2 family transporter protein, partial [bacterium]|nr:ABC-2 family transporter protein [bacterium]